MATTFPKPDGEMTPDQAEFAKAIRRRFEEGLDPATEAALLEHLKTCETSARLHERYAAAERALYSSDVLTPAALDRVEARLFGASPPSAALGASPRTSRGRWGWMGGLGAAALGAAVLLFGLPNSDPGPALQARGGETSAPAVLRVLVVNEALAVRPLSEAPVATGSRLVFMVRSAASEVTVSARVGGAEEELVSASVAPEVEARLGPSVEVPTAWAGETVVLTARSAGTELAQRSFRVAPRAPGGAPP